MLHRIQFFLAGRSGIEPVLPRAVGISEVAHRKPRDEVLSWAAQVLVSIPSEQKFRDAELTDCGNLSGPTAASRRVLDTYRRRCVVAPQALRGAAARPAAAADMRSRGGSSAAAAPHSLAPATAAACCRRRRKRWDGPSQHDEAYALTEASHGQGA